MTQKWMPCRFGLYVLILVITAACAAPPTPTATPLPTAPPPPPATSFAVVTLAPPPTETATAIPTLDFAIDAYIGRWDIEFIFTFDNAAPIEQMRFLGIMPVEIDADGQASALGSLITVLSHSGCQARFSGDGEILVIAEGRGQQSAEGPAVAINVIPEEPENRQRYQLICPNTDVVEFDDDLLWPVLEVLELQPFIVPLVHNIMLQNTYDLSALPNRQGTLTVEVRVTQS